MNLSFGKRDRLTSEPSYLGKYDTEYHKFALFIFMLSVFPLWHITLSNLSFRHMQIKAIMAI